MQTIPTLEPLTMPVPHIKIIAAIPCYNTQKHIADIVSRARKYADAVIVVDDGSTDLTLKEAHSAGALVISHKTNRGKGAAMKTALENTDADIVVFLDGDGQHNPDEIPDLILPILQGKADFVIGSRFLPGSRKSSAPFLRTFANFIAANVISLIISFGQPFIRAVFHLPSPYRLSKNTSFEKVIVGPEKETSFNHTRTLNGRFKKISDCTSGFTAMKKACWDSLNLISNGYQIETEIIFEQAWNGFTICEVPISCKWGESSTRISVIVDGLKTLWLLLNKLLTCPRRKINPII